MLDIHKIQADIEMTRQSVEQSRATVEKMCKENQWFPILQISTTMITSFLTGSVVVYVLTQVLQK